MEGQPRYRNRLATFAGRPSFTAAEAIRAGISYQALSNLAKRGEIERVGRGHYRLISFGIETDVMTEDLVATVSTIRNGVICLISALKYYDLTEEIPRQYWIAIPNAQRAPSRPHTRIVRMRNIDTGKTTTKIDGVTVAIFDPERCIVDAFRYLSREIAIKALRAYLLEGPHRPNIPKLVRYAELLRVNLDPFISSVIT